MYRCVGRDRMGIFHKKITTVLGLNSSVKDDLRLTTHSVFKLHSYIKNSNDISLTPSGQLRTVLPEKSNLHKMDKLLEKTCKTIPNCDVTVRNKDGVYTEKFADNFGRYWASKVVDNYGTSYYLRGDMAAQLTHQGNIFIQCDRGSCKVFIPNQISVDYRVFAPKPPERGQ